MHGHTYEQSMLHEITWPVVEGTSSAAIVHGPWTPDECQAVLSPWFHEGWIELVALADAPERWNLAEADWRRNATAAGTYVVLAKDDASELLADPTRWIDGSDDGMVMLCRSDEGMRRDFSEWERLADRGASS
jgi:hypothetical protein